MSHKWTTEQKQAASDRAIARNAALAELSPAAPPPDASQVVDLSQLMAEMRAMRETVEELKGENKVLAEKVVAAQREAHLDEFGLKVDAAPPNDMSALLISQQRDGTLQEKLDAAELQARERNDKTFDRERLRKALLGEEVEDLNKWHCPSCGKLKPSWNKQSDIDTHMNTDCKAKNRR